MRVRRRSFGPTVLTGLSAGVLGAVAGARDWAEATAGRISSADPSIAGSDVGQMPLAAALALVVCASWGALLVTRSVVRRAVAALGALASAGWLAAWVAAWSAVPNALTETLSTATAGEPVSLNWTAWFFIAGVCAAVSLGATAVAVVGVPGWPEMGQRYDAPRVGARRGGSQRGETQSGGSQSGHLQSGDPQKDDPQKDDPQKDDSEDHAQLEGDRDQGSAPHREISSNVFTEPGNLELWQALDAGRDPTDPASDDR